MRKFLSLFFFLFSCYAVESSPGQQQTVTNSATATAECSGGGSSDRWPKTIPGMPLAQAPSATPTFPPTIAPPYDGDPLSATQLRVDDLTPLQNGVEAARLMLYGGGIKRRVLGVSNTVLTISGLAVLANLAGTWTVVNLAAGSVNPTVLSGGLVNSTRYWVYVKISAGPTAAVIVTTDAPDAGLNYRTGDDSALWLSTFVVTSAGNLLTYTQSDLDFVYDRHAADDPLLSAGNATVNTTVALNYQIPALASSFSYFASTPSTVAGRQARILNPSGSVVTTIFTDTGYTASMNGRMALPGAHQFNYYVDNAAQGLTVTATGFTF